MITRTTAVPLALSALAILALAGCASSDDAGGGGGEAAGLPAEIKLVALTELTGPVTFSQPTLGANLALQEINDSEFLGPGVTLSIDEVDAAFDPQVASQNLSQALATGQYSAILGPSVSSESLAVAPIAQAAGVPIVYVQSGVAGLLDAGDMQFRAAPPQFSYFGDATARSMQAEGIKTVASLRTSSNPTYQQLGAEILPPALEDVGIEITSSFDFESSATDFQSAVSRIVQENPDAVSITLLGQQVPTAVVQLRQSGYEGLIYATTGVVPKQLETTGELGVGVRYPTPFTASSQVESVASFVSAFKAENGVDPSFFHAEGYDRVWWLAKAIKEAGSVEPSEIADGLRAIAAQGFDGAQGALTFADDDDARLSDVYLVEWTGDFDVDGGEAIVEQYDLAE